MQGRWFTAAVVLAVGTALALAYGVPYGSNNQLTYLLAPLSHAHPELYRHDWLLTETTQYHPVFAMLAAPLYDVDPRGVWAFGIAQVVVMAATWGVVYRLLACTADDRRVALYCALAGLLALGGARSLAGSYLFAGYLQPSSLATLGWLVAMVALVRDRLFVAGIALAAAGAWHANFALLGIPLFGAVELWGTRRFDWRRIAKLCGPSLVVIAAFVPAMVASAHSTEPELALRVLTRFHAPGHYLPGHIRWYTPPVAGWLAIAWGLVPLVRERVAALWRFAVIGVAACIGAVIVCSIPPLLGLTKLYVWRIGPFAQLACMVIALVAVASGKLREVPRARLAAAAVGAAVVIFEAFRLQSALYGGALAFATAAVVASVWLREVALVPALAVALLGAALETQRDSITEPQLFAAECGPADCALNEWIGKSTSVDAVFLVPPYMGWFRLTARRAIVVDSQSPPLVPDELVAWYRRMCALARESEVRTHEQVEAKWDALPPEALVAVAKQFQVDYLVLDKLRSRERPALPVAYENAERIVYRVKD